VATNEGTTITETTTIENEQATPDAQQDLRTVQKMASALTDDGAMRALASQGEAPEREESFSEWLDKKELGEKFETRLEVFRDAGPKEQRFLAQFSLLLSYNSGDSAEEFAKLDKMRKRFRQEANRLTPALCNLYQENSGGQNPEVGKMRSTLLHELGVAALHSLEPEQEGGVKPPALIEMVEKCSQASLSSEEQSIANAYLDQRKEHISPELQESWKSSDRNGSAPAPE
jgi:hypothetical protein